MKFIAFTCVGLFIAWQASQVLTAIAKLADRTSVVHIGVRG